MSLEFQALKFANLLAIADLSASNGDGYAKQEKLIGHFRAKKQPFVATMPMRHRFRCDVCRVERGESIYHFENPKVPHGAKSNSEVMWGTPVGVWIQIKTSELHSVLAHGNEPSSSLRLVLESVNRP